MSDDDLDSRAMARHIDRLGRCVGRDKVRAMMAAGPAGFDRLMLDCLENKHGTVANLEARAVIIEGAKQTLRKRVQDAE